MKTVIVMAAAWVEIIVGVSLVAAPDFSSRPLFAAPPEGVNVLVARGAGITFLGLGVACLPLKLAGSNRGAVLGLLVFNLGATIVLAWIAAATSFRGVLLWPFIILPAVIAAVSFPQFLNKGTLAT